MKLKLLAGAIAVSVLMAGCSQDTEKAETGPAELETQEQKLSYIFGQNIGGQFKSEEMEVDMAAFSAGMEDALTEAEPRLSEDEARATLEAFQQQSMAEQEEAQAELAASNKEAGEKFLAEKAGEEDVVVLDSGLQYQVLEEGSGASPGPEDEVEVHYHGTLIDGTEFDSSVSRGEPARFQVDQVIPGWTEALQLMEEGAKWKLFIPPSLAYGPRGAGQYIGPNETLVFEVELLGVNPEDGDGED